MLAYYAARAREYERIYDKPERQADLRVLERRVEQALAAREVIELACGTGYWTRFIARSARRVVALDANPQTLEVARSKGLAVRGVEFGVADAYALAPELGLFDGAFAGFWWSHVPLEAQPRFLESLRARLAPGALVVMLDNRYVEGSSTALSRSDRRGNTYQLRRLDDGTQHEVLKNFPNRRQLHDALDAFAEAIEVDELPYFWYLRCRIRGKP
ncbi:MAG: class I SAM-dependent methyltransferase [Burkholderiaceae bacterium]|nr:class I SAM-dependent methyltransferase [Burkholderiaceae bacterium]